MFTKFLNPKNDVAFKRIFGSEKNKDILIHFINDMITFKNMEPITEVTFLKNTLDPIVSTQKTSIVDILCRDRQGNTYVVEMQVTKEKGFEKRALYYASKAYISQANVGGKYHNLQEVIFLAITDFIMFPSKKSYKSDHVILDKETYENDLKDFSFTFLELPKFKKKINQLSNLIEKWAYFFKRGSEITPEELQTIIGDDPIFERAYEELDHFYWSEQELINYEAAEKREMDYIATMDQKFDEGLEVGEKRGIEKMAKKMLNEGIEIPKIMEWTGLTENEIRQLKGRFTDFAIPISLTSQSPSSPAL